MTRVVLLGDSHLARLRRDLAGLHDGTVVNGAEGGATTADLLPQALSVSVGPEDLVVVSVGTNDTAPWKQVPLGQVLQDVQAFLAAISVRRLVYLVPPGVDEERLRPAGDRTNEDVAAYAAAISGLFAQRQAVVVDAPTLLAPVGPVAFADDGLHLSGCGYDVVVPALRQAIGVALEAPPPGVSAPPS